ncbi:hypothetical protein ACLOJK_011763 [Asimina triloba]
MPAVVSKVIEDDGTAGLSRDLFVGNISTVASEGDLIEVFGKHGALDAVIIHATKSYAFVFFRSVDDARVAMDALQGALMCGSPMKIKFARPDAYNLGKPSKCLWFGAVGSSVTKELLEEEFRRFGKIDEFKFFRDRNSGVVDYHELEDATVALKNMNGKHLVGEEIRVDFLRSQISKRENWSDSHGMKDGHLNKRKRVGPLQKIPPNFSRNFNESSLFRPKKLQLMGEQRDKGQPSKILWIGYPPSVQIDEQMLHNSMILYGEIDRIKCFPSRHYSFVEFRSSDEAQLAKEGLQGRLFNDPRIKILFLSSELAPTKENMELSQGFGAPAPDMFFNEPLFGPWQGEFARPSLPLPPNNLRGPARPNDMPRTDPPRRPFGLHGFDPQIGGPFSDALHTFNNFPESNVNSHLASNWRRHSPPATGMAPFPVQGIQPCSSLMPGTQDGSETGRFQSSAKRSRIGDPSFTVEKAHNTKIIDSEKHVGLYGLRPRLQADALDINRNVQAEIHQRPVGVRGPNLDSPSNRAYQGLPNNDYCWRGVIAKGGTPVCHARCIPIGKGIDSRLPEVVNCSARTGLDMLTKHYAEAHGFDIVYFLPDSENDFASYTELLHYLEAENRAGVAKLDDGTTLFFVPPSDFLAKVLNVSGPERLYGVVLKFPKKSTARAVQPQLPLSYPSEYVDRGHTHKEDRLLQVDHNRALHEDLASKSQSIQPASLDHLGNPASAHQAGISLTPELIANLAALIPAKSNYVTASASQLPIVSSIQSSSFFSSVTPDDGASSGGQKQEHEATVSGSLHDLGPEKMVHVQNQFSSQALSSSQYSTFVNANGPEYLRQVMPSAAHFQEASICSKQAISAGSLNNSVMPSMAGQYSISNTNPQYQFNASQNSQSHSLVHPSAAEGALCCPELVQPKAIGSVQVENLSQPTQSGNMSVIDFASAHSPQEQCTLTAPVQLSAGLDADKNQRYKSTLQFAASLLLQIQQQQPQQGNA